MVSGATVEFQSSLPVELIAGIVAIARRKESPKPWMSEFEAAVGSDRVDEIVELCRPLRGGMDLVEFTADAPDSDNVDSFLEFVGGLSDRKLTYYLLGRMCSMEQIPQHISEESVVTLLEETDTADSAYHDGAEFSWANDPAGTRDAIVEALRTVWDGYIRNHMEGIRRQWREKIGELTGYVERSGAPSLWQLVSDSDELPMEIPAGQPYKLIQFVPSCLTSYGHNYLFGYGKIIVIFSCEKSLKDAEDSRRLAEDTLSILKALSDKNRLRLLRLISKGKCEINGKQLAEVLKLSPSVVSRHLAQLRAAGLIEEHSKDNRNITYTLREGPISELSASLSEYLKREPHG